MLYVAGGIMKAQAIVQRPYVARKVGLTFMFGFVGFCMFVEIASLLR